MKIVNQGIKKVDSIGVITGRPVYTDDLNINNNPLIIKILRSPHAFAKIIDIDKSIAEKVPGVECVLTHEDVPKTRFTMAGQSYPEPSPYDRRILDDYVRYVGDEVAIIAAVDEKTAVKAMKLIKVQYEVFEGILDYEKAVDNPVVVHPEEVHQNVDIGMEKDRNIASSYVIENGDIDKAFEESDVIVEETYYTQPQIHNMMETYRSSTYIDTNGRLCVVSSTQVPFHVRRHLARALEIPRNRVRVIKPRIGGGFGGKQTAVTEIFPAIVTLKTGKPAKIIYTRREANTCSTSRHAMKLKVKIGSDLDGNIKGLSLDILSNTGAYGDHAPTVTTLVAFKTFPLYDKAAVRYDAKIVYTNTMTGGAFRGYGATQGTFAVESAVNELAKKLDMDPTVIREKNLVDPSPGNYIVSGDIKKCIEKGKEIFNWDERYPARVMEDGKIRAAGMAVTMQGSGIAGLDTAAATLKLWDDGTYTLFVGVTDMGQGSDTVVTQMAAEILECSIDKIVINSTDTDISPYDPGAYASSGTYVTGNAVVIAAKKMREEILKGASKILDIPENELDFDGECVASDNGQSISLDELALRLISFEGMNQITVTGTWGGVKSPPPFIAGFAEVEVDPETGVVELLDILSVVDCGLPINPNLARVQVEGGMAQGIGLALYEDIQYDSRGAVKNDTLMQYKIPCRKDIKKMGVEFVYSDEPTGPFGAKSIGEVVMNSPAPAIVDAVYNATGVRIRKLPVTAEKVFFGMQKKI